MIFIKSKDTVWTSIRIPEDPLNIFGSPDTVG